MTNDYKEARAILSSVWALKQKIRNYERRRDKLIEKSGPNGYRSIDLTRPSVQGSKRKAEFEEIADEIALCETRIFQLNEKLDDIKEIIYQLDGDDQRIIELCYLDHMKVSEITEILFCEERTVYNKRKRALNHFAEIYPF